MEILKKIWTKDLYKLLKASTATAWCLIGSAVQVILREGSFRAKKSSLSL